MAERMLQVRVKRISFEAETINSYELVAEGGGDIGISYVYNRRVFHGVPNHRR